jgi:hypothetical protein
VRDAPPTKLPAAAVFRGIGWAGLHSALDNPKRDTFMVFKSSPFGSISHSHADQNSFAIMTGGRSLAIASGYYGPSYGFPHHAEWTRQTKANNCILVNGKGQAVREEAAKGRIETFHHQKAITYLCGDAAPAYKGALTRFKRHVLFVRPGVFVLLDDLAAPQPAEFSWLLHAWDKMTVDDAALRVVSQRKGATLEARLACEAGLAFRQTDQFDTPYNEGNPPEYHEQRDNQWHFTATTKQKAAETRIAAVLVVRDEADTFKAEVKVSSGVVTVAISSPDGRGEVRARLRAGTGLLEARWNAETFKV